MPLSALPDWITQTGSFARLGAPIFAGSLPESTMGQMRVVVNRIEPDGTMHRRVVDTSQQSNPRDWEDLAARALAIRPAYRPIPGTAIYHLCVDGHIIQVGEYDLQGPLRDLVIVAFSAAAESSVPPSSIMQRAL